eukprot:TRINITY_DN6213_c0_g1_i1.p2 TRINITY_DN6213_c0_g1~~TRINITY_DN6213_c0_g1_i1.p2  ORF type:complete len:148 (+),score=19.82 TRINITY_DN6213_c0_g1_i1:113-556(+)
MGEHASLPVKRLQFYDQTLATLGYKRLKLSFKENGIEIVGYGKGFAPFLFLAEGLKDDETVNLPPGIHIALSAPDANAVRMWHKKCIELGAKDEGGPGLRPQYHPLYYGAFILDPSGWKLEATFHGGNFSWSDFNPLSVLFPPKPSS